MITREVAAAFFLVVVAASIFSMAIPFNSIAVAIAQDPFDITTEQSADPKQAVITVKLATNNTVVIPPNGTIIEVGGNVTQIDNNTVVITPDNETVTETPGNVTVIDPPAPEPCQCPEPNATEAEGGPIDPVLVTPAPGQIVITQNGTQLVPNETQTEPIPVPPVDNQTTPGGGGEEPGPVVPPGEGNTTEPAEPPTTENGTIPAPPTEPGNNQTSPLEPAANFLNQFFGIAPA
jgi:hypothetical protein